MNFSPFNVNTMAAASHGIKQKKLPIHLRFRGKTFLTPGSSSTPGELFRMQYMHVGGRISDLLFLKREAESCLGVKPQPNVGILSFFFLENESLVVFPGSRLSCACL